VHVGTIDVLPVLDGMLVADSVATKPWPDESSWIWQDQGAPCRQDGRRELSVGGFLVRTGDRVVLVDAGAGPSTGGRYAPPVIDADDPEDELAAYLRDQGLSDDQIRRRAATYGRVQLDRGELPSSLRRLGVRPEDVTDLVFTHLHFDHIGWASARGAAFFPNATLRCASADLDYFLASSHEDWLAAKVFKSLVVSERFAPVLDRVETWSTDGPLLPGVDVRLAPGHTPGSSVVVLSSGSARAMLLGDIVHCTLELMDDDFNLLVDHDQALADQVRTAYARELEGADIPVAAAHFPGLRFGRLLPGTAGIRRFVFTSS
jgi:glyoxylase-like metal-dependent hydrolase (beta-lactamase superfamily II)